MERVTEPLTLLLNESRPTSTQSKQLSGIALRVMELMKNEAAVYSSSTLTESQAKMRALLLEDLAQQFGLPLFQEAFKECLVEYDFRATPSQVKKQILRVKEAQALKREAALHEAKPQYLQLLGCANNCGDPSDGLYRVKDESGSSVEVCECLRAHWAKGGTRNEFMK